MFNSLNPHSQTSFKAGFRTSINMFSGAIPSKIVFVEALERETKQRLAELSCAMELFREAAPHIGEEKDIFVANINIIQSNETSNRLKLSQKAPDNNTKEVYTAEFTGIRGDKFWHKIINQLIRWTDASAVMKVYAGDTARENEFTRRTGKRIQELSGSLAQRIKEYEEKSTAEIAGELYKKYSGQNITAQA